MSKVLATAFLFISFLAISQTNIPLKKFEKRIQGMWYYESSINPDSTFTYTTNDFAYGTAKIYGVIHIFKQYRKVNARINKKHPWIADFRKTSCLAKLEFFGGFKGYPEYMALESDSTDKSGNLIEVKISLNIDLDKSKGGSEYSFWIEELTSDKMVISGWKGAPRSEKHIYRYEDPKKG
jgi:hypothetical protein